LQVGGSGFESLKLHQTANKEKAYAEMRGLFLLIPITVLGHSLLDIANESKRFSQNSALEPEYHHELGLNL